MPIGIIVWLILIFIITCAGVDGCTFILLILGSVILIGTVYAVIENASIKKALKELDKTPDYHIEHRHGDPESREQAIREWEKKWGRKHPSRE